MPHIGYLHSGFEKLGEHLDFNQYVTIVDRMNYISPLANEIAWHHAVEKLLGIELTPRCKYLRTILAELMRLHDHLLNVGTMALDLGAFTAFLYGFEQREKIYDIVEYASGQRFHTSYTRVGGVLFDVNNEWIDAGAEVPQGVPTHVSRNRQTADAKPHLRRPHQGHRRVEPRGRDQLRRDRAGRAGQRRGPRLAQGRAVPGVSPTWSFKVICSTGGDCYARYLCSMREMVESLKIIEQALDKIPAGPVNIESVSDVVLPAKPPVYRSIEGLIQHFEVLMPNRGYDVPHEEIYAATEAPNGELGFYVVGDGTVRAYRARTRPPSYIHFGLFPHIIRGYQLSDVVAVLGSLNIIAAELDR